MQKPNWTLLAPQPNFLGRIQDFFSQTYKSKIVRNVAIVASGTAGAQIIGIIFTPIITRLYGPEAFGLLGIFIAITAIVTPIAALTYPIAIVLPKKDSDAKGIARLSIYIALGIAALVSVVLAVAGGRLVELFDIQEISSFILLIPLVIVFAACFQINQQWLIRKEQFNITARVAVFKTLLINSANMSIGLFKPFAAVLIVIYTLGYAIHAGMLFLGIKKNRVADSQKKENEIKPSPLVLAKKHYDFLFYRAPQTLLNAFSQSIPVLLLAGFWDPAAVGFYAIGSKILTLPTSLVSKSVGSVLYPKFAEAKKRGDNLKSLITKSCLWLLAIGIVPYGLVIVFGPWLFGFVFGDEWYRAGEYARWLSLSSLSAFSTRPCIEAIPVIKIQGFFLLIEILTTTFTVLSFAIGHYLLKNDIGGIALFSITFSCRYILIYVCVFYKLRS
ncbi:MAG: lipopolysaccharide biosynthesis protein [Desulfobacterales bacterium]|nr:lipopolysaccharide biosynthesis protein [Desulfobacterales bacterium]